MIWFIKVANSANNQFIKSNANVVFVCKLTNEFAITIYINPAVHKRWVGLGMISEGFKNVELKFICFKNIMKTVC